MLDDDFCFSDYDDYEADQDLMKHDPYDDFSYLAMSIEEYLRAIKSKVTLEQIQQFALSGIDDDKLLNEIADICDRCDFAHDYVDKLREDMFPVE